MSGATFSTPSDLELEVAYDFDAPPDRVFDVWTSCDHLPEWSGPEGWSLAACEVDLRPGGSFRYLWRSPDGVEAPSGGTYVEVERPSRLVTSTGPEGMYATTQTLELSPGANGGTSMRFTVRYGSTQIRDAAMAPVMQQGMAEGYDRLAAFLRANP